MTDVTNKQANELINILIAITLFITLGSGLDIAYNKNVGGFKQTIATHDRQVMMVADTWTDRNGVRNIQRNVTANDTQWKRIGSIAVPKLGILLPVYNQPYNLTALKQGAQVLPTNSGNSTVGQGNLIIVGHNLENGHSDFSALQQVVSQNQPYLINGQKQTNNWLNGQMIYVATEKGVYEYKIDNQQLIGQHDLSVKNDTPTAQINLLTCLEPDDEYRIVTHGNLQHFWDWNSVPLYIADYFNLKKFEYNTGD